MAQLRSAVYAELSGNRLPASQSFSLVQWNLLTIYWGGGGTDVPFLRGAHEPEGKPATSSHASLPLPRPPPRQTWLAREVLPCDVEGAHGPQPEPPQPPPLREAGLAQALHASSDESDLQAPPVP